MHRKFIGYLSALLVGACVVLPGISQAGGALTVEKRAPFEKGLHVPDAVRAECDLETNVPKFVQEYAEKTHDKVNLVDQVGKGTAGQALSMKIVDIYGAGGGAWSGAKHLAVEGTLWENGKVKGTFRAVRYSGGGMWGGYKGTCSILGRCAKAIGKDVAGWLESPGMDSRLGDAK
jgi:hypothetical protein